MKRSVMVILVLVLALSLAGPAPAATPKIKSQQCLNIAGGWSTLSMAIKPFGVVKKASGNVKFYAIHGEFTNFLAGTSTPVTGTGHMNGTKFHFSVTGSVWDPSATDTLVYTMMAEWDLANTAAQTINFRLLYNSGDTSFNHTFTVMPNCKADNITYSPEFPANIHPDTGLEK